MTAESQNFLVFGGDTRILNVSVVNTEGAAVDITDAEIEFSIHKLGDGLTSVVGKSIGNGITVTNAVGGEFKVVLNPEDTNIIPSGQCPYECRLTDQNGYVTTIMTGQMVVR